MLKQAIELSKAKAILQYELTPETVAAMVTKYDALTVIPGDTASYKTVRATLTMLVHTRTQTDKRRKDQGEEARAWIKELNGTAKQLLAPLVPLEARLRCELKSEDDRKAEIRAAKERKEQARIDGIRAKIDAIKTWCYQGIAYDKSSEIIRLILLRLKGTSEKLTEDDYMEFLGETQDLLWDAITKTKDALEAHLQWEKEEVERKAEAVRLAEIRKQQEAEQEMIDTERRKLLEEKQEVEAEKMRQEEEATRKEFERQATIEAEKAALAKAEKQIREAQENQVKAEIEAKQAKERAEGEAAEKAEREEKKRIAEEAERKRQEKLRPDKEKLLSFVQTLHDIEWPDVKDDAAAQLVISAKQMVWAAIETIRTGVESMS